MQRLIISSLSALVLNAAVTPAFASDVAAVNSNRQSIINELPPVTLVQLAYRGYFQEQGIPGYGNFETAVNSGKVTPETLVQSAIAKGRLSPETLNDRGYLNIVQVEFEQLDND